LTDAEVDKAPKSLDGKILVPFPYESTLSGKRRASIPDQRLWYRRTFSCPSSWRGMRTLLHFGAVNYVATVWINSHLIGSHRGGYDAFSFDISDALKPGKNEITVSVQNPLRAYITDAQVLGKQRIAPGGIFYTASTGIWQTAWLEPVPAQHASGLRVTPDIDRSRVLLTVQSDADAPVAATVLFGHETVGRVDGRTNAELEVKIPDARLWSPGSPNLYDITVRVGSDSVRSYFGMRKISLGKDDKGRVRIFLNNQFVFQVGALDQGYWPDGIYTAPTDRALESDIVAAKKLGFNLLRKHVKVEPARWYYYADKLGILVWQDMPAMFGPYGELTDGAKEQFEIEWRRIIAQLFNSPAIVVWIPFNEGWGQHDTERVVALTKELDPSRLVNNASGWVDKGVGDVRDTHAYPGPASEFPDATRAAVNGEFGAVELSINGHLWDAPKAEGNDPTRELTWEATKSYQELLKAVYGLEATHGTSAVVYTQLVDTEREYNGFLTYDRAIMKFDPKVIAAANRGQFLPLGPKPKPDPKRR
jgi:beta-galactosidase/beta-glucuronidase